MGIIIGNKEIAGKCSVYGVINLKGKKSKITIDRGGLLYIASMGSIYASNDSMIISSYNEGSVSLYIDGTLYIDYIEQLVGFDPKNIIFGDNGKLVILNKYDDEHKLLWTTPNGIYSSELYHLFGNRLSHIEYHIQPNTGIGIDQYYEFYSTEMREWYNNVRLEKAIYDKLIIWHDGGFIELYRDITPWVSCECNLYSISGLLKSYGLNDRDKLQSMVNHLKYAGSGNITFRFVQSETEYKDVILSLNSVKMESIINKPQSDIYTLTTDNNGDLFYRNRVSNSSIDSLISSESKYQTIFTGDNDIKIL